MIYNSVAEIFESLDKIRNQLVQRLSELTEEQVRAREGENGWSVTEIVEHLAGVENGVTKIIAKLLAKAEAGGGGKSDGTFNAPVSFVEQVKSIENRKLAAPERTHPQGTQSIAESLTVFDENRRLLNELRPRIESVDSTNTAFPHPFFGNLNLYQWLVMIAMHEYRHLGQIEEILAERV